MTVENAMMMGIVEKLRFLVRGLFCVVFALWPRAIAADDSPGAHLSVGGGVGYVLHFGKAVDATTGATRNARAEEHGWSQSGAGFLAQADLTFATLGRSDLGIALLGMSALPGPYFEFGAMPRYRLTLSLRKTGIAAVRPFLGTPGTLAFEPGRGGSYYLVAGLSAGLDFILRREPLAVGLHAHGLLINPLGPEPVVGSADSTKRENLHMDAVYGLMVLSYQVY